jgi:hypothetical protein
VYEYANAVNQANGSSKSANANFLLAPGNTNPQGIADPPAAAPGLFSNVTPAPIKLDAGAVSALARSAATEGAPTQTPQKPAPASAARFIPPASPPQTPLHAIDTAVAELFDADKPFARPNAQQLLSIAPLVVDLAAAMR